MAQLGSILEKDNLRGNMQWNVCSTQYANDARRQTGKDFTIQWSLWEIVAGWAPADLYFVPMPAHTTLPPNANFGLSDRSYCSRVFTALHRMQTRSSDDISDCPSARQTCALWQNGRKISPDFYTMRKIIQSSFLRRRMVGGDHPYYCLLYTSDAADE